MSEVFVSYARPNADVASALAHALRARGHTVWRDDALPAHRVYGEVIEERLRGAKAVVVIWSVDAARSHWVRAEADLARGLGTLVQASLDGTVPPLPFNQIQCADLAGWPAAADSPGWQKLLSGIAELIGGASAAAAAAPPRLASPVPLAPRLADRPVVGVRPFVMLSGTNADGLADGLLEEVVTVLSRQPTLAVAAHTRGGGAVPDGGAGTDYVLDGTVQTAGSRVRLTARLMHTSDGAQIWTQRYDGTTDDLFGLQEQVALSVAGSIESIVRNIEIEHVTSLPIEGLVPQQLYVRGVGRLRTQDREGFFAALEMFETVIARDPLHRHALASAALCHYNIHLVGWWDDEDATRAKGTDFALRSLQLSDSDAYSAGLCALALAQFDHPIGVSLSLVDRLIELNPALASLWFWSGMLRLMAGDLDLAAAHFDRCLVLDPRTSVRAVLLAGMGCTRMLQGRLEDAAALLDESIRLRALTPISRVFLAACYGHLGRGPEARAMLAHSEAIAPVARFRFPFRDAAHHGYFRKGLVLAAYEDTQGQPATPHRPLPAA